MKLAKSIIALGIALGVTVAAVVGAYLIETDFNKVDVSIVTIKSEYAGDLCAKLYVPQGASASNKAPAVLAMHGYQNDKDTNATYAIELARNGFVVLSLDSYGHGDTTIPLRLRGWDASKTFGPDRYKLMTSFSYIKGDVEGLGETTLGGDTAFNYLQELDFVDETRVGITGHSLGTWCGWDTAKLNPDHGAIVVQCGEPEGPVFTDDGDVTYKNVLLIQAEYDEFNFFRDMELTVPALNESSLRYNQFAGQSSAISWDKMYGSFDDGTARQMNLYHTNHRLITYNRNAVADSVDWFNTALKNTTPKKDNQISIYKDILMLVALLAMLASLIPLLNILLRIKPFRSLAGQMPSRYIPTKKVWWKTTLIAIAISAVTYPFVTQLGHGLFPLPKNISRILVANGMSTWLGLLAIISIFMFVHWYRKGDGKKAGVTMYDMGISYDKDKTVIKIGEILKTILVAAIMFGWVYLWVYLSSTLFNIEFRFIWPFFRPFTGIRFWQFLVYIPAYLLFFTFNAGIKLFGQLRQKELSTPAKTQTIWWLKSVVVMLGGLFIVILFEYIPFFAGIGPGFDAVGLSLFGGPFMSALILIVPQFIVLFFITTYCYRKTGKVYLGSLITALLAVWVVTGGSAFF